MPHSMSTSWLLSLHRAAKFLSGSKVHLSWLEALKTEETASDGMNCMRDDLIMGRHECQVVGESVCTVYSYCSQYVRPNQLRLPHRCTLTLKVEKGYSRLLRWYC